jgi:hypothetical protein
VWSNIKIGRKKQKFKTQGETNETENGQIVKEKKNQWNPKLILWINTTYMPVVILI